MLYVIGTTVHEVERWREAAGLPRRVVRPITIESHARGRRLELEDVVQLPRVSVEMPFAKWRDLQRALAPCFRNPRMVNRIPVAMWPGGVG